MTAHPTTIQEVMTQDPVCVTPGITVREAARLMQREDTGILPVVQEGSRRLVGVVTDRDIAIRVVAEGRNADTRVLDVMSGDHLHVARPNDSVQQVLDTMGRQQVRRIPVVDETGDLVGIVAQADVVRKAGHDREVEQTVAEISEPGGRHNI